MPDSSSWVRKLSNWGPNVPSKGVGVPPSAIVEGAEEELENAERNVEILGREGERKTEMEGGFGKEIEKFGERLGFKVIGRNATVYAVRNAFILRGTSLVEQNYDFMDD